MKPGTISIVALALATMLLIGASCVSGVYAANQPADGTCWNGTLTGSFGFYRTGNTPDGPLAAVGIIVFDGNGNQHGRQSISRNGDYSFGGTFTSQYTVAGDCTFKLLANGSEFSRGVIVDGGKGFYILSESQGNAVYGIGTKIHP